MSVHQEPVRIGVSVTADAVRAVALRGDVLLEHTELARENDDDALRDALAALGHYRATAVSLASGTLRDALDEPDQLAPVAVLRFTQPGGTVLPPFSGWPEPIRRAVRGAHLTLPGGHDLTGRELAPLDHDGILRGVERAVRGGVRDIAICATGSCAIPDHEEQTAELVRHSFPEVTVTLSHEVGGIGLRDRENAAALNAALRRRAAHLVTGLERVLRAAGLAAPLMFVANHAGAIGPEYLRRFPVAALTGDWSATASGAAHLAGVRRALVCELTGDQVRAGMVVAGTPPRTRTPQTLRGIRVGDIVPEITTATLPGVAAPSVAGQRTTVAVGRTPERIMELTAPPPRGWNLSADDITVPSEHAFAAAVGAARSRPEITIERLVRAESDAALDRVRGTLSEQALAQTTSAGADPATPRVEQVRATPVSYLPGGIHHLVVRASGDLPRGIRS
ncbi:hydantoinase/oxoprolinase N-terminal domain-containing protein [Amycolatopsis sp. CA-230715]|uniref:hydantoinase/oxoprolinase N-terminal domain-containing protein n=1 Tax=Amycolatopsis sp. CA-230715 TaxID=2745196 RepID=UPI001C01C51D|nr:hydantoinase/oxoprolinase N-terminal domain-containing protein [Amycolatopsis sp. CA-230715]QWF85383.1 hypothetical protein HUW46_08837 [Amycolatopsis sp. CA-230715]